MSDRSLRSLALDALQNDVPEGAVRSCFASRGDMLLLADSTIDGEGNELFARFPLESNDDALNVPIEWYSNDRAFLDGLWTTSVRANGEALEPSGAWKTICEDCDDRYAFCERSIALTRNAALSRRLFFAYNESLALVVDELSLDPDKRGESAAWEYETRFPLARGIETIEETETREISTRLRREEAPRTKKTKATKKSASEEEELLRAIESEPIERVDDLAKFYPLSLREWRAARGDGDFRVVSNALELTRRRQGATLVAALAIDLNARRAARPCMWSALTVGEDLRAVDADEAVGARLQLGREQYVLYVSTSVEARTRSILSRHLLSDFMFGKFTANRGVDPIVDVEILD